LFLDFPRKLLLFYKWFIISVMSNASEFADMLYFISMFCDQFFKLILNLLLHMKKN